MPTTSHNPATGETWATYDEYSDEQVEEKLAAAHARYQSWKKTSFAERAELMTKLGQHLRGDNAHKYGEIITKEMGKTITESIGEINKCAKLCDYYAEHAEEFLAPEIRETDPGIESFVRYDPIGVVLAVMPWNYPFWQVMRFAVPVAMAGNVGILKHASNVPGCALAIEEAFRAAGFPENVFTTLLIGSKKVEGLLRDDRIRAAALTGSEYAGSQVAMVAGEEIKKTVLELGGSDPFIVLEDADLNHTCNIGTTARLMNAGQSCIAAKRFIVVESILNEFIAEYVKRYEAQVIGDPLDEKTTFGPMVNQAGRDEIEQQVNESVAMGAEIVIGGKSVDGPGYFYEPTILKNVTKGMPVYDQEVFGPVAAVIAVADEAEAIRVANDTELGLGASIWTTDIERAKRIIPQIDAGSVFVNQMVVSDIRLPFGGSKKSGYGRELSIEGIREFVNVKTVKIQQL